MRHDSARVETALDPDWIPGERFVERSASAIVMALLFLIALAVVVMSLASVNTTVEAPGALEPFAVVTARPRESGIISTVAVSPGQAVRRGALLFSLDGTQLGASARELESRLAEMRLDASRESALLPIDLETARERQRLAATAVVRSRSRLLSTLVENGMGRNVDSVLAAPVGGVHVAIDMARAEVRQSEAEFRVSELTHRRLLADSLVPRRDMLTARQLEAQLALLRQRLAALDVRATAPGVVLSDRLDLLIGRAVREGDPVLELGSVDGWHAQLLVSEADVHRVRPGQEVQVELNAADRVWARSIAGTVSSVSAEPWTTEPLSMAPAHPIGGAAPRYRVLVTLLPTSSDSLETIFRRGFTVQAHIRIGRDRMLRVFLERVFGKTGAARSG